MHMLDGYKVLDEYNVMFDADPNLRLEGFTCGWGDRSLIHPHLSNVANLPIRLLTKICLSTGTHAADEMNLRRSLALVVVPLVSGLTVGLLATVFSLLGLSTGNCIAMSSLGLVSFTQLVFGSIPEHFALGGFTIVFACLLAAEDMHRGGRVRWWTWGIAGVMAAGITITNLLWVSILLVTCLLRRGERVMIAFYRTLLWGVCVVAITYTTAFACAAMYRDVRSLMPQKSVNAVHGCRKEDPWSEAARTPIDLANTLAPASCAVIPKRQDSVLREDRFGFQFTLRQTQWSWSVVAVMACLVAGVVGASRAKESYRWMSAACILIITGNLVMHCLWGSETFLYSQHWLGALLIVLGGSVAQPGRQYGVRTVVCWLFVAGITLNNVGRLMEMSVKLAGPH